MCLRFFKVLFAGIYLYSVCSQAAEPNWFSHGRSGVEPGVKKSDLPSSKSCADCHQKIYSAWQKSKHASAWTNSVFREGFKRDGIERCIVCHAPISALPNEGVNCITCHMRDGVEYGLHGGGYSSHETKISNMMADPKFCAGCHQFNFLAATKPGKLQTTKVASQNTYSEWQAYSARGGKKTCQQCHMPQGSHTFLGSHNRQTLLQALLVRAVGGRGKINFNFELRNIGHHFPTGDLFRRITLEVRRESSNEFRTVATFARKVGRHFDLKTMTSAMELRDDTTLKPFEKKQTDIAVEEPGKYVYRVRYHYVLEEDELKFNKDTDFQAVEIAKGSVTVL